MKKNLLELSNSRIIEVLINASRLYTEKVQEFLQKTRSRESEIAHNQILMWMNIYIENAFNKRYGVGRTCNQCCLLLLTNLSYQNINASVSKWLSFWVKLLTSTNSLFWVLKNLKVLKINEYFTNSNQLFHSGHILIPNVYNPVWIYFVSELLEKLICIHE